MKNRAKNGTVPKYFNVDYKTSYQKSREEVAVLKEKYLDAFHSAKAHHESHLQCVNDLTHVRATANGMKEKLEAAEAVVAAVRQCGVHGAVHLPSGNCPQEMQGCQGCPIDAAFRAYEARIK
jgi:hypothetical protein